MKTYIPFAALLLLFLNIGQVSLAEPICSFVLTPKQLSSVVTRRNFLRFSGGFLGAGLYNVSAGVSLDWIRALQAEPKNYYSRTILEQSMITLGKSLYFLMIEKNGRAETNPDDVEQIADSFFRDVLLAPAGEETLFRLLPVLIFGDSWTTGVLSSAVNANEHKISRGSDYKLTDLPLKEFFGAVYYWYLIKERGFSHSVIAHMANNNMVLILNNMLAKDSELK